jgi:phage FluMu gp28-like protein
MNIIVPAESAEDRIKRVRRVYWLPTQERWIKSKARLKLMEKTRRFGGSYANNYSIAEKTARKNNPFDAWIGSRDLLAARLSIHDVKFWAKKIKVACDDRGEVMLDREKDLRAFEVEFANGRFARGLSSSPDAFAGKQGWMSLDEFALHKDARQLYGIVQPAIMRGGSLSIISTHRGTGNFFNELVKEIKEKGNPKKFDFFSINIEDAVEEGLWIKIQQMLIDQEVEDERLGWNDEEFLQSLRNECATEEMWLQEYMCKPCDDSGALLTWEDIMGASRSAVDLAAILATVPDEAERYLGMDIGRRNHPSVLWQWVKHNGLWITEDITAMANMKFSAQEEVLFNRMRQLKRCRAAIDATGLGMQLAENAVTEFPGLVDAVTFNPRIKIEMATKALKKFQDRIVRIPDEVKVQYELYSIKQKAGSGDGIAITSEAGLSDGHSDYAWGAFLGLFAGEGDAGPVGAQSVSRGLGERLRDVAKSVARRMGRTGGF